jgi:hypothetical protein
MNPTMGFARRHPDAGNFFYGRSVSILLIGNHHFFTTPYILPMKLINKP